MTLKEGDFVLINYVISVKTDDQEVVEDTNIEEVARKNNILDANRRYEPYLVVIGRSNVIAAIDEELRNMDVGQVKEFVAPPEKAYGPYRDDLVIRVPIKQLRRYGIAPVVGRRVEVGGRVGVIKSVTERFAFIDFNHPLAGKQLKIRLEVTKKLESDEDKARYLVARYMPLDQSKVAVAVREGVVEVALPREAIGLSDLESRLQLLAADLQNLLGAKELRLVIDVPLAPRPAQGAAQQQAGVAQAQPAAPAGQEQQAQGAQSAATQQA